MFDFIHITFIDILDILLVGFLIYQILKLIRGTAAVRIFAGILILFVIWVVVRALNMKLLSMLMGQMLGVGTVALIVIFQPEIRRFLLHLGTNVSNREEGIWKHLFNGPKGSVMSSVALEELTGACRKMSETNTGALLVFRHTSYLNSYIETGDEINADINRRLIENIFFKNTPLHDGAMILSHDKIIAARCTLPISESMNIPPQYGMRHRAAIGITEGTDATAVVVSEETGEISFIANGEMKKMNSITELRLAIENSYK